MGAVERRVSSRASDSSLLLAAPRSASSARFCLVTSRANPRTNPATAWHTSSYSSGDFGGLKQGLGLWFDLGAATGLRDIEVLSLAEGWSGALRFSDDARSWSPPGPIEEVGADHVFPAEGAHRYWMIWITKLTTTPGLGSPPDPYTVGIREVEPYPG